MAAAQEEAAAAPPSTESDATETEEAPPGGAESDATAMEAAAEYSWLQLRFDRPPRRLYHFARQFRSATSSGSNSSGENFLKGVKWSPDGSSFLTSSDDNSLRLFYL
jgi:telomerase Cajal body protein 1